MSKITQTNCDVEWHDKVLALLFFLEDFNKVKLKKQNEDNIYIYEIIIIILSERNLLVPSYLND